MSVGPIPWLKSCRSFQKLDVDIVTERTFQIAVLPGDGIGVDVTHEAVRVLRALEPSMLNVQFELNEYPVGSWLMFVPL